MRQRGFTLIETMIVVIVAGIIIATGVPAFLGFQKTLYEKQARERLVQDIRIARQTAVTRHKQVVMVFGAPPATSNFTSYTIHVDADGDRVKDTNELLTNRSVPTGVLLTRVALNPVDSLIFDPSGNLYPGTSGGMLVFTNNRGLPDTLMISGVGMVYRP